MSLRQFCLLVPILTTMVSALVQPSATAASSIDVEHRSARHPVPTQAPLGPKYGAVPAHQLFGRQEADVDTCGYTDGDADYPYTCTGVCSSFINDYWNCCPTDSVTGTPLPDCYPATACQGWSATSGSYTGEPVLFADQTLLWYGLPFPCDYSTINT